MGTSDNLLVFPRDLVIVSPCIPSPAILPGSCPPALTVAASFDEGKKQERVTLGKVGHDVFAARTDEPNPAKIEAEKFDEAVKALDELSK